MRELAEETGLTARAEDVIHPARHTRRPGRRCRTRHHRWDRHRLGGRARHSAGRNYRRLAALVSARRSPLRVVRMQRTDHHGTAPRPPHRPPAGALHSLRPPHDTVVRPESRRRMPRSAITGLQQPGVPSLPVN
ncbi:hypothetical protein ACFC18_15775 [Streptomyces sp. NPDC056121]|uniref:hypothetical protein n=1 Tax=unclassified Streptomyces TaxID=2593676 RepID=UPI00331CFEAC